MSIVDNIYRHCLSGPFQGDLTAQNVSLYHTSPFTIHCEKFVSSEKKDSMSPYRELLLARGLEHEHRTIARKYPQCRPINFETPEAGFRTILEEMAKGTDVICGLPLFFLPEDMQGRIDVIERRNEDDCRATKRIKDWLQEQSASGI